jgi:phosphinothricin acetyltransferase
MNLRRARPSDLDAVTAIYNREVENATSTFDTETRTGGDALEWFMSHESDAYPLIVAEEGGEVVGWASLSPWSPRGAYARTVEGSLFIRDGHRGLGVGSALTGELIRQARCAGHGVLIARVEMSNEPSRRLLLRSGFRSVGTMRRVGQKFGRILDVEIFELELD